MSWSEWECAGVRGCEREITFLKSGEGTPMEVIPQNKGGGPQGGGTKVLEAENMSGRDTSAG